MGMMDEADKGQHIDRQAALAARDWLVRLTSGEVSEEELVRFKAWQADAPQNALAFAREKQFWNTLDGLRMPQPAAIRSMGASRRRFLLAGGAAMAASVAGVIAVPRLRDWQRTDFSTSIGERGEFRLPDGSLAFLNTDSAIDVDYRPGLRLVSLMHGEAEFQVNPAAESLFRVAACGGNCDAVGTAFSVRTDGDEAIVTVREGQVRVAVAEAPDDLSGTAHALNLTADQQVIYREGGDSGSALAVDASAALAWRQGRIIFDAKPFGEAVAELARYLPERVMLMPGIDADLPVTSIFSTGDVLAGVEVLARIQGRSIHRVPGVVLLIV